MKEEGFFVVRGTENLKFSWEVKAVQKEYEYERLEEFYKDGPGMEEADLEIKCMEQYWEETAGMAETEPEEIWMESIQEAERTETEQEGMWYGTAQGLYGH